MATKKDLVEAYSFSRRRLVTAFVSGAPGGREVEPARPGRTIVGGVALAVLLAAGAAIAGVFAPRTPEDWQEAGLIISKETGAAYVILDSDPDELRPVINTTSAKLILGENSEPTLISQDTIDGQEMGDDIGIFGAPASVPTASLLINSGWTACTAPGRGVRVTVAETPDTVPAPGRGLTVENAGKLYVVLQSGAEGEGARIFEVPPQERGGFQQTDSLLASLDLPVTQDAIAVPREWINLFPVGAPLDISSFPVDDFGQKPGAPLPEGVEDATIGSLLQTPEDKYFLVTDDGPVELSDFAALVYRNVLTGDGDVVDPMPAPSALGVGLGGNALLGDTGWPQEPTEKLASDPCAQLTAEEGEAPVVALTSPGTASAAGGLGADERDQSVELGRGAYVLSGGWSGSATGASPYLIDAKGRANPLVGPGAASQLGYADVAAPVVPDTWVKLFTCGVDLSEAAALQPPVPTDPEGGSGCA